VSLPRLPTPPLALCCSALLVGCLPPTPEGDRNEPEEESASITVREAIYRSTWDWGDATPAAEGGWSVVNDLGIEFHVESGHLTAYASSLVPCVVAQRSRWSLWPIPSAYADHGVSADPSVQPIPVIEDLAAPVEAILADVRFPESDYCQVHYLVAGATEDSQNLSSDSLVGQSISLQGAYRHTANEPWTALAISSEFPNGTLHHIDIAQAGNEGRAEVHIQRSLSQLFDAIDPLSMTDGELDFQLLTNLIEDVEVSVTLQEAVD
jgi:hypothetical protein